MHPSMYIYVMCNVCVQVGLNLFYSSYYCYLCFTFSLFFFSPHHDEMMTVSCVLSDGVGILDTKFGTVQAWQPFPERRTADRKVSRLSVFLCV